jgi:hypothetical protein
MTLDWRADPALNAAVPANIDCIDCGGVCSLLTFWDEDPPATGDLATYRCRDCLDRWDLVVPDVNDPGMDDGSRFSDW